MATRNFICLSETPLSDYYLLKAYDLGAPVPTPRYWISREVSYAIAPVPDYGGPYGPIHIEDTWRA